ncbi:MAG: hypothetical protein GXP30_03815 [Verrucomicrobia bacterium]|nr:hypothetical protein [Verrucomicrobiota bacterium]
MIIITVCLIGRGHAQAQPSVSIGNARVGSVSLADAELGEVLAFISSKSEELLKRPVNFILVGEGSGSKKLSLNLNDIPLSALLKYACELTGCVAEIVPDGVLVGSKKDVLRAKSDWNEARVVTGRGSAASQLSLITIPSLQLEAAAVSEVITFLQSHVDGLNNGSRLARRPNFLLINNPDAPVSELPVSLELKNVRLSSVIRFISAAAGPELSYRIDRGAVVFGHKADLKMAPRPQVTASPSGYVWMKNKLIPKVDISGASLEESLQLIRHYVEGRFNVVNQATKTKGMVKLKLKNISLASLLAYICEQSNTNFRVENRALIIIDGKKRPERASSVRVGKKGGTTSGTKGKPAFDN